MDKLKGKILLENIFSMWNFFSMWLAKVCPFMRNLWRLQLQLGLTLEVGNFLSLSLNFDLFCGRISLQLQLHHHNWVTSSPRYHLREKMDKFREREMERQIKVCVCFSISIQEGCYILRITGTTYLSTNDSVCNKLKRQQAKFGQFFVNFKC